MHAIVVGAGPAGLAVSLGLAHIGCTVDLLEKHSGFDVQGSTLGFALNGQKALRELLPDQDVSTLLDQGILMPNGSRVMAWWNIRDWLLERVNKKKNGIQLHMGAKLVSIDDTSEECVMVQCQDKAYRGDLVIGADGVHSQVRSLLGVAPNPSTGYHIWRGSASAQGEPLLEALLDKGVMPLSQVWGTTTFSVFCHHPKLPYRLNWAVAANNPCIQPGVTTPMDLAEPHVDETIMPIVTALWQKSAPHDLTCSNDMATTVLPNPQTGQGWGGRGRVTLIGDAAHAIRPTSGLGTALAMEDCLVLQRKLKPIVANNHMTRADWHHVFMEFENERLGRVQPISNQQQEAAEVAHRGEKLPPWSEAYKKWVYSGV